MITTEEIKKVEKLQKVEKEIRRLKEDYKNAQNMVCYYEGVCSCGFFNNNYDKELARIIKHRILKLKRKRKELLEGK